MRTGILAAFIALGLLAVVGPGTTYTQPTPIIAAQATTASGTSLAVAFGSPAPSVGDTVACHIIDANATSTVITPQSGFTALATPPPTTGLAMASYQRVVAGGDPTTYTFTISPAQAMTLDCDWLHAGAAPTIYANIAGASGTATTHLATSTLNPNTPGTLPLEVCAQANASISTTDPSFGTSLWNKSGTLSAQELTASLSTNLSGVAGSSTFATSATAVCEVLIALPAITPFTVAVVPAAPGTASPTPGGTPTPAPTASPGGTIPAMRDMTVWWCCNGVPGVQNPTTTAAQVPQYLDYCIGPDANTVGVVVTACSKSFTYTSFNMGQPSPTNGKDYSYPFVNGASNAAGRTCPAAATGGNFWADATATYNGAATPDETGTSPNNWLIWPNGTIAQGAGYAAASTYGSTRGTFNIFVNFNSTTARAYFNAVVGNCQDSHGFPMDSLTGSFQDNTVVGKASLGWTALNYAQDRNFGPGVTHSANSCCTSGYASLACGTGYQAIFAAGTPCILSTTPLELTSLLIPQFPNDDSFKLGMASSVQSIFHCGTVSSSACQSNGAPWRFITNGWNNTDPTLLKQSHELAAMSEEIDVGAFGSCGANDTITWGGATATDATKCITGSQIGDPYGVENMINDATSLYNDVISNGVNPGVEGLFLADSPSTPTQTGGGVGDYAIGTGDFEHHVLFHYGLMLALTPDGDSTMINSFTNYCGAGGETNCFDSWTPDYWQVGGRITPWPAEPTGAGGTTPCGNDWHTTNKNGDGTGTECTTGGWQDSRITCNGIPKLFCWEFQHFWVFQLGAAPCGSFDRRQWQNCAVDIGPAAIILNESGAAQTLSTANLAAWLPNTWSALSNGFVLFPCQPNATASPFGASNAFTVDNVVRCAGASGFDVGNGGNFDYTTSVTQIETKRLLQSDLTILVNGSTPLGNVANYDGCNIGVAGDPYNQDITSAAVDTNSASIIAALPNNTFGGSGGFEASNTATNATAALTINTVSGGHSPPFWNATTEPWLSSFYIGQTTDHHATVLNTSNCKEYEGYSTTYSAGTLAAYSGAMWDFTQAYSVSAPTLGITGTAMASDLCFFCGMIKWNGEIGATTPVLNHALNFAFPTGQGVSQWGILYPARGPTGIACTGTCTHPLHYGDHLRLHAGFTCPVNTQALAICNALKQYGMFYGDQGSADFYLGDADNTGATNPYAAAVATFFGTIHITDFDVLTEPTLQCQPGHSGCT